MSNVIQKTLLTIAVVGIVVFIGYSVSHSNKAVDTGIESNDTTPVVTEEANIPTTGKKMAFSQFIKQGGSYKCEVKQAFSDMESNGTVYINGADASGVFTTITQGQSVDSSFIVRDGYTYTWSSMLPSMGFKVKAVQANTSSTTSAGMSGAYSWNADQIGDYNCEPWVLNAAQFTVPSTITFKDVTPK